MLSPSHGKQSKSVRERKRESGKDRKEKKESFGSVKKARDKQPSWTRETLDLTRDRSAPKKKKGKGRFKSGSGHQYSMDQKRTRLRLQVGTQDMTHRFDGFCEFVRESANRAWFNVTMDSVEYILLYIYDMIRARNLMDIFVASVHLVKHYAKTSIFTTEHLHNLTAMMQVTSLQSGDREFINSLRDVLRDWTRFKTCPLVKKITQVLIYTTSFGLYSGPLPANALSKVRAMEEHFSSHRLNDALDFVYYLLDLLHFVCDKAYGVMFEGYDPKSLFVSSMEYDVWLDKAQEHLAKSNLLSNPTAFNIDIHEYLFTLKELSRTGSEIYKFSCELDKSLCNLIRRTTYELQKVEMTILSRESAQSMRPVPFCVAIEGDSSVGKSKVAEAIHVYFGNLFGKPITGSERYTKNATCKFWDGFTSDQWSLSMDDVAMWSSDLDMVDESVMDIVRIVNNMPYMPDMAALEDKGKTPFKGELVIITTNSPDLKCNEYFAYPFAAARRVPFHIRVRPRDVDGFMLKADTSTLVSNEIPDSWLFDIYEPTPKTFGNKESAGIKMQQAYLKKVLSDLTMRDLLLFIKEKATLHRNHQKRVVEHSSSLAKLDLCSQCALPPNFCACVQNQGGIEAVCVAACTYTLNYMLTRTMDFLIFYGLFPRLVVSIRHRLDSFFSIRLKELKRKAQDKVYETYSSLKPSTVTMSLLSIVSVILVCYKMFFSLQKQGTSFSTWGKKYPEKNERESCWQKETYVVDTFDSSPQSLSMKGLSREKQIKILDKACAYLRYNHEGVWKFCRLLNIKGQKFLTPNHCMPENCTLECEIVRTQLYNRRGDVHAFVLNQSQIERFPNMDLCMITIPSVTSGKDLTNLFVKEKALVQGPISIMKRDSQGEVLTQDLPFSKVANLHNSCLGGINYRVWKTPSLKTEKGDCGALMYRSDDLGLRIMGIHESYESSLIARGNACAIVLTYEFISSLDLSNEVSIVAPQLGVKDEPVVVRPIGPDSCLRSLNTGCIKVYGNIRPKNRPRSKVQRTILCQDMMDLGFELKYGPPVMGSLKPWMINLEKQIQADNYAEWDDLQVIKRHMLARWLKVDDSYKEEVRILDFDTVINGQPGVRYIDAIPRKTSAGFPFCKPKIHFLHGVPSEPGLDKVEFDEVIMAKVKWRLENYMKMNRTFPVYRGSLKDEATTLEKIEKGKTRVFMGAPIDFTIAVRSLLLSFVRIVQKNKFIFESAPGTEAQCIEWDHLYKYLTEHGDSRMIFGDFSGFDSTMRSNFMRVAFDMIEDFHRECGATEEHCRMIRALSYDIVFPLVEFNGDLIELNGKNPSGQPLTVIINGIINCMYMRYCFLKLNPNKNLEDFDRTVNLLTYGDDNGMGVSEDIPWFNHTAIQECMSNIGVTYTMADKTSRTQEYIHIDEADFLKRKWRYEPDTDTMVCPLNLDSIIKSLMIGIKSTSICEKEHAASIISSAQLEFFWHGKDVFSKWNEILATFVSDHDLHMYMPRPLQKWDTLVQEYKDRSKSFLTLQDGVESRPCELCGHEKSPEIYEYCGGCEAMDQCMLCDELSTCMFTIPSPRLWMCHYCYHDFFYYEQYDPSLIMDYYEQAVLRKRQQSGWIDLPLEWFCHAPTEESAIYPVWDRRVYACVPSAINGTLEYRLGCRHFEYEL